MMKVPAASPETRASYDAIVASLEARGAESGAMFGMPSIKIAGKGFAGLFGDALVFKLSGDTHARALALRGAVLFDPSGMGRAMKEWIVVPRAHAARWPELAHEALEYVSGDAKAPAVKKTAAKPAAAKAPKPATGARAKSAATKKR